MRLLLDTNVFLWALAEPKKLSTKARNAISKLENSVYVSPVTAYELSYKHHEGKLPSGAAIVASFGRQVSHLYATKLTVSVPHALAAGPAGVGTQGPF